MAGKCRSNRMSTTLPRTETMTPRFSICAHFGINISSLQ